MLRWYNDAEGRAVIIFVIPWGPRELYATDRYNNLDPGKENRMHFRVFDQLSIQQFYSLAWVLCLVRFVIGASNYAFMNVIKNTTITHVSVFQALFSRFLYLSTSEGHIKPTNPRYKSVSFVLYSLRKIVLLKHRFTIPYMLWSNSTLGPHLPCWRIWTDDGDCELYLTHHK